MKPEESRKEAIQRARDILAEEFTEIIIVCSTVDQGETIFDVEECGNEFALTQMKQDLVNGDLYPDDEEEEEEIDDNEGEEWQKTQ